MAFKLDESLFEDIDCDVMQDVAQSDLTDDGIFMYEIREPDCVPDVFSNLINAKECALKKKVDKMYKVGYTIKDGTYVPTGFVEELQVSPIIEESYMGELKIEVQEAGGKDAWLATANKTLSEVKHYRNYLNTYARKEIGVGGNFDTEEELEDAINTQTETIKNLQNKISTVENM